MVNILGANLADMQLIINEIKKFNFLCVTDVVSKWTWVISLKNKKERMKR